MTTDPLPQRQAALIDALVRDAPTPPGFPPDRIAAVRATLLAKRCGEIARHWPVLFADPQVHAAFVSWAGGRPKTTSYADGYAFALEWSAAHPLSPGAEAELRAARNWRRRLRRPR